MSKDWTPTHFWVSLGVFVFLLIVSFAMGYFSSDTKQDSIKTDCLLESSELINENHALKSRLSNMCRRGIREACTSLVSEGVTIWP